MASRPTASITRFLASAARDEGAAGDRLWFAAYEKPRRLAPLQLAREGRGCSLQLTAPIGEPFRRVGESGPVAGPPAGISSPPRCKACVAPVRLAHVIEEG